MIAVAASYCLVGRLSLLLAVPPGYATAIWPSAGIALAATLIFGSRVWPAIWIGSLTVNLWISFDGVVAGDLRTIAAAAMIAAGASIQAVFSAWVLCKFRVWPNALENGKTVARLLILGGPVGCIANASIGVASLLVLGMVDTTEFGFNWVNWWVGDAIGVLVFTPLLLIWSGSMGRFWRRRAATISVPSTIALVVVVSFFLVASNREQSRINTQFLDTAYNVESAITSKLDVIVASLGGIQSLFASSQNVDADEFRIFSRRALQENPELLALSFNRQVSHAQRTFYEEVENPANRLRFTERNAQGQLVDAGVRENYTVVQFIQPLENNQDALGLDVASDTTRLDAIQYARDTGRAASTSRLHLVQAEHSEPGLLIFAPIYGFGDEPSTANERTERISGYAVGVVLVQPLLENAIAGLRLEHVSMQLYDEDAAVGDQLLTATATHENTNYLLAADHYIPFAGRQWRIRIEAGAEYLALHRAPGLVMILGVGLLLCGLLGAFTLTLAGNERREALRAAMDPLTGLANRREFEQRLNTALTSCKTSGAQHAFAYCDLDKFKFVNDTAGHQAGDELLKIVAGILRARLRSRDIVARLGGDEFGLLMEHCPIDKASEITEEICADIHGLCFERDNQSFRIGVSIGVIALNAGTNDVADAMTRADEACYEAKDLGRNQVYVDRLDSAQVRRRRTELQSVSDLRDTLKNNELLLYKQPIWAIDSPQGEPKAFELLLRLPGNPGEVLKPAGMISVAERYGVMAEIDRWVIRHVFQNSAQLCANGSKISINLSANSLDDDSLKDFVQSEMQSNGVVPETVCFEISETAAISNLNSTIHFINEMKQLGCCFALDNFGAGISSFRYLNRLPVDWLKIDGSLIQGVVTDPTARAMVTAIQQIADSMGITTIANWVSDRAILAPLQEIGVRYVQGFALGQPVPLDEIATNSGTCEKVDVAGLKCMSA